MAISKRNQEFRELVLKNIVRQLIWNSLTDDEREEIERQAKESAKKITNEHHQITRHSVPLARRPPQPQLQPHPPLPQNPQENLAPSPFKIQRGGQLPTHLPNMQKLPLPPPMSKSGKSGQKINLGKLARILRDPSVTGIECTGPGKNILVNRSGAIQTTSITLNKEEIDGIMKEVSDKTRIPVISGMFKAVFADLLITAVISEYVGTRFIINKRTPFSR